MDMTITLNTEQTQQTRETGKGLLGSSARIGKGCA